MSVVTVMALLVVLIAHEGMSAGDERTALRCQCIAMEKRPIGRLIATVEVRLPTSDCRDKEYIAILKRSGKRVCLDPTAPWVRKVLEQRVKRTQ
ncbi:C-X-C motif chemokine 2-like [Mugil cephalus]|uniref:C-X-C motif chemokine 2-like n=1 Tax=Mugil cephalus TaxID=48193 RepID=UPI001FB5A9C5|nr:C-X-C motif chemokine 2-like [Mugil cephalus]